MNFFYLEVLSISLLIIALVYGSVYILKKFGLFTPDSTHGCILHREEGCSHVDGMLCNFPKCEMLEEFEKHGD